MSKDDGAHAAENIAHEEYRGSVNEVAPGNPRYIHIIDMIEHYMFRFVSVGDGSLVVVTGVPLSSPHVKPSYTSRALTVLVT